MRRFHRGQPDLTLIRVLVVASLGALAAVMVANVNRFFGKGQTEAAGAELRDVQTAMIAMMADNNLSGVTVVAAPGTNDMTISPAADLGTGSPGGRPGVVPFVLLDRHPRHRGHVQLHHRWHHHAGKCWLLAGFLMPG
jgi:hypothetical protein